MGKVHRNAQVWEWGISGDTHGLLSSCDMLLSAASAALYLSSQLVTSGFLGFCTLVKHWDEYYRSFLPFLISTRRLNTYTAREMASTWVEAAKKSVVLFACQLLMRSHKNIPGFQPSSQLVCADAVSQGGCFLLLLSGPPEIPLDLF